MMALNINFLSLTVTHAAHQCCQSNVFKSNQGNIVSFYKLSKFVLETFCAKNEENLQFITILSFDWPITIK